MGDTPFLRGSKADSPLLHAHVFPQGRPSLYALPGALECLPCAQGCEWCEDARPCVAALNWPVRTALLALSAAVICCLPAVALFTVKYGHVKVGLLKTAGFLSCFYLYTLNFL